MKHIVLLAGTVLGTLGAALLAGGYGAAGVLLCVLAVASVAVALSVTWRLEDEVPVTVIQPSDRPTPGA